jgi:UDP-N-acetylglucosamine 1-carboxyvinyltransferase
MIGPFVECLEITGGSILSGEVKISGAKNSSLAVLAGALCSEQELCLRRIPDLHDVRRMFQVLQSVGVQIQRTPSGIIKVDASNITSVEPCPEAVRKLRASFFVIGALVGRQGEAIVPLPGGCNIGARPIDLHVRGLEALGAQVEIR